MLQSIRELDSCPLENIACLKILAGMDDFGMSFRMHADLVLQIGS